ncbi:MAG: type II toxin-antitoxin system HicB family antitoxin [Chloroflexota bacterium]
MLTEYIDAALKRAVYEKLDDGYYYGEIPGIWGVYAHEKTLVDTQRELKSVLEDWIVFGLVNGFPVPPIDGIQITSTRVA